MSWKNILHADPVDWLLQGEPWVQYNTLTDILEKTEDNPKVKIAKQKMVTHPKVSTLLSQIAWPWYPLKRHNDANHPIHTLTVLADFGFNHTDPGISPVIKKIVQNQSDEGAFHIDIEIPTHFGGSGIPEKNWIVCDAPTILYALTKMGVDSIYNESIKRAQTHLASLVTEKGVLCTGKNPKFRGPGRKNDPCPYATLITTKALADNPEMGDIVTKGAQTLLWHWEHQKERKIYLFGIGTTYKKLKYPYIWYDILHVVDVLSKIDTVKDDPRLHQMVNIILSKHNNGKFTPESVWMAFKDWEFGQKRIPSPWLTFLVVRILKRIYT